MGDGSDRHARIVCLKWLKGRAEMPKVGFVSLGCPKNLVDSEVMMGTLAQAGYEITRRADEADVLGGEYLQLHRAGAAGIREFDSGNGRVQEIRARAKTDCRGMHGRAIQK